MAVTIQKSYLKICEEELNPGLRASCNRAPTLHNFAAVASAIAHLALIICTFATALAHAPVFAPLAVFGSALIFKQACAVHNMFEKWSGQAAERAHQLNETYKHYQTIKDSAPEKIQQILKDKGINYVEKKGVNFIFRMEKDDPQLTMLKPLIARHLFWENHVAGLEEEKQECLTAASKLEKENPVGNRNKIFDLRSVALEFENEALKSKVKNAFISAVIRRPHFTGTLQDLGTFSPHSGQERAINIQTGVPNATDLFTFKGEGSSAIQYHDAKRLEVSELGMRLMTVMN